MITKKISPLICQSLIIAIASIGSAAAETNQIDDLYGDNDQQSIASGRPVPKKQSPAVTTVMTAQEIDRIGARSITDVLEYMPGVHVSQARSGVNVVSFRGISSESNSQVLMLVNGIPMRNALFGGKPFGWNMPVKNISHIEVIRGPGSMLYGGDATTGVINIVLKTGSELKGGDAGTYIGNQNTESGWIEYGDKKKDLEFSGSVQGGTTTGFKGLVTQDAQTIVDSQFGTHASQAPGYTNYGRDDVDARVDVSYKDWLQFRGGYQRFNNVQTGIGAYYALDNIGSTNNNVFNADLSLKNQLSTTLDNKSTIYYLGQSPTSHLYELPAGTMGGLLPGGVLAVGSGFQGTIGLTTQSSYTGLTDHVITGGAGFINYWDSGTNQINAIVSPYYVQQIPLTNVSTFGKDPILASTGRVNTYGLLQDEWNFASNWNLTTGFRYDYYSDVSPGISPRVALIWNPKVDLTTKLMYSHAFRPPSFLELNQPMTASTLIKPETIDSVEFQVEKRWSRDLTTSGNLYWYKADNLITSLPTTSLVPVGFFNANSIDSVGFETEARYAITDKLNTSVNYSYNGIPKTTSTGLMPTNMVKSLTHFQITPKWSIGLQTNWIGERMRSSSDPRAPLAGYFTTGATLTTKIAKPLDLTLRVNNIFDVNTMEPSQSWVLMPGDIPTMGRTILGQAKISF